MYVDGLIYEEIGFERFQSIYFLTAMSLAILYMFYTKTSLSFWLLIPLFGLSISLAVSPINMNNFSGLTSNIKYFLRGPILFIFLIISFKDKISYYHVRAFCFITIATCTASTFAHAFMSFGFQIKGNKLNPIFNGYFSDTNSAAFLLLLAALVYFQISSGILKKFILTLALIFNVAALDSKAGILLVFIFLLIKCYFHIFSNNRISRLILFISIATITGAILAFPEQIAYYMLNLVYTLSVKDAGVLNVRFATWDILSIVTATRNLKFLALNDAYPLFGSFTSFMFGNSFWIYQDHSLIESDLLDSLMALGLLGCLSTFMLYFPLIRSGTKGIEHSVSIPLFILVLSMSLLVGHVFFSPASVMGLAIVASYYSSSKTRLSKKGPLKNETI